MLDEGTAAVTGATLSQLLSLVDRGLLRRCERHPVLNGTSRYDRHPLLWWFARDRLETNPARRQTVERRHRAYYADFVAAETECLIQTPQLALASLTRELENLRAAWHSAPQLAHRAELARALDALRAALGDVVRRWSPDAVFEAPLHRDATHLIHQLTQLPEVRRAIPEGAHPAAVTLGWQA